jgi:hypothetical protein
MDSNTVAIGSAIIAAIIAVAVPWFTFRLALRQDQQRWLREQRSQLYVDLLTEAYAEERYFEYTTTDPETQQRTEQFFRQTDVRLPPLQRAQLGSRASIFGSPTVNRLFNQINSVSARLMQMTRAEPEARAMVARVEMGRIRDQLQQAVRRELGTDNIEITPSPGTTEPQSPPTE